jgi:glycosyltransferase involved in cell wall biosynthesis
VFGFGVLRHLLRYGAGYDVVHTASFPYFSLLAAAAVRPLRRFRIVVDWHEFWTEDYWREYLGPLAGRVGHAVQSLCVRVPQRAFCFSRLSERRLRKAGLADVALLEGQFAGELEPGEPDPAELVVVFAGRHIPEKQVPALIPALVSARERLPDLRAEIYGDGPERAEVLALIRRHGASTFVGAPGFVGRAQLDHAIGRALCLVLPSRREGYGQVVVEAAARGVPSLVVTGPDNAATELVEEGVNGAIASSASAGDLADAILRIHEAGPRLRRSTADWFAANADRLSLGRSLETVLRVYAGA